VEGEGEDITEVWIHYRFGENRLTINETPTTLADIWDEADMGDMGEVGEIEDEIQDEFRDYIYTKTGIIIHFDSQI
jgi:regulatory protein YycH of two-component signal transduction system YycFG